MRTKKCSLVWCALLTTLSTSVLRAAELPGVAKIAAKLTGGQQMLELKVRIIDADGNPVAKAKVTPWALQSSQGHGRWSENDEWAGVGPKDVFTAEDGTAIILYPRYRHADEQIATISVSLFVDHPEYAYLDKMHIDVPLENEGPHEIKLAAGVPVEIRPLADGKPADLDNLYAIWSDGRSWQKDVTPEKTADGTLRIPAMPPGKNSVLLVRLDGERATHFSKITDFELVIGEPKTIDIQLRPSLRIEGKVSDDVPRPIQNGRLKTWSLQPSREVFNRVTWFSWAPIRQDGTFTIDGWPAGEPLQVIALCDGYIAKSGKAPAVVANPPDPAKDGFTRPQVFEPAEGESIELAMTPLVQCIATALDGDEKPVAGIEVESWPNVQWWNNGSQIYCHPLVRGERLLRDRDYMSAEDKAFPQPFSAETGADGKATLELPAGHKRLAINSEVYELPVFLGRRDMRVTPVRGETTEATLRLQPRGTEKLGEWDKLAGVVFGCSTREGRRICALPEVQKKMNEFAARFREGKNQRDPELLSEAYTLVANAFVGVGDQAEAAKWRQKAAEQAALANSAETTELNSANAP
jgi:hypothetical protein